MSNGSGQRIHHLSIREMIAYAGRQLKGVSREIEGGYCIELRDYTTDISTSIFLTSSKGPFGGLNLRIESQRIKEKKVHNIVNFTGLEHIYVTWETAGECAFLFAEVGRFNLINISYKNGAVLLSGIDKRADQKPESDLSDGEKEARAKRRTFYHIGKSFDQVSLEDPAEHQAKLKEEKEKEEEQEASTEADEGSDEEEMV